MLKKIVVNVLVMFCFACGSGDDGDSGGAEGADQTVDLDNLPARDQCFEIVSGISTSAYPSVVLLLKLEDGTVEGRCSGTFVGHNTVITAAHCVGSGDTGDVAFAKEDCDQNTTELIYSTDVFHHGLTSADFVAAGTNVGTDLIAQDLAVLIFPDDTWAAHSTLSAEVPQAGDEILMVGYGLDVPADEAKDSDSPSFNKIVKRYGNNELDVADDTVDPPRIFQAVVEEGEREAADAGTMAIVSSGDSGGPLLFNGNLVGVASTASATVDSSGNEIDISTWLSLMIEDSRDLLQEAVDGGANIEGF